MGREAFIDTSAFGRAAASASLCRVGGQLCAAVVVKSTFALHHGRDAAPVAPEPIVAKDGYYDRSPVRSVETPSDVAPRKPRGEVLLSGHAYAPGGVARATAAVRLALRGVEARVDKVLHVYGDRDAPGDAPAPFQRMPLVWERAAGGDGTDNPVGRGPAGPRLPNLVDPADPSRPACFAALSPYWPARRRHVPAGARRGLDLDVPDLAEGFDFDYFLAAPEDQRTAWFRGDEWIALDGLHPALTRIQTRLPGARAAALVLRASGAPLDVALVLDTIAIDADRLTASLVWRGLAELGAEVPVDALRVVAIAAAGAEPIAWPEGSLRAPAPSRGPAPPTPASPTSSDPDDDPLRRTSMMSPAEALAAVTRAATPFAIDEVDTTVSVVLDAHALSAQRPGTPFAHATPPAAHLSTTTTAGLPFRAAPAPDAPPFAPSAAPEPPLATPLAAPGGPAPFTSRWATGGAPAITDAWGEADAAPPASLAAPPPYSPPPFAAPPVVAPPLHAPPAMAEPAPYAPPVAAAAPPPTPATKSAPPAKPPPRGDRAAIPIVNPTSLVAVTVPWQVRPPKDSITVVIKGTFDLVPDGPARLRAEGDFPIGDVHLDDDPEKSLVYGSDLGVFKPKADVVLTGSAHAPTPRPVMQVELSFGTGARGFVRKAAVMGERRWQKALLAIAPTSPEPFTKMPLTWERAFGGPAFGANPVGAGHKAHAGEDGVARLPNLEDPQRIVTSPSDDVEPVCFAPIGMLWKDRWSKLGTYDRRWFKQRWPYFPEDFDWSFFQIAPATQQLPYLEGDEAYRLVGMHPDHPRLDGRLPGLRARCFIQSTEEAGGELRELPLVLDTAAFDVDAMKLCLVWRAFVEVSDDEAPEIEALFVTHEELGARPINLVEARAAYVAAAVPPPPEETSPDEPTPADEDEEDDPDATLRELAATKAEVLAQLAAAGVPLDGFDRPPPAPPPPPDPAAVAASLRAAGASAETIADVMAAIAPPPERASPAAAAADVRAEVVRLLAAGAPLDELDLAGAELADLDFSGRSLRGTILKDASLARSILAGADLEGAVLAGADLAEAHLPGAILRGALLAGAKAQRADFTGAILDDADLGGADLTGATLADVQGTSTQLPACKLAGAVLRGARLEDADFTGADLEGATLDGASLPQVRLYDVTARGASFRGASLPGARAEGAELGRAMFVDAKAPGSVWESAKLDEASFQGAVLTGASFARARCRKAVFSLADLTDARFRRAKLGGAAFVHANLMGATFEKADLTLADLRGANLHAAETWKAVLDHANLDGAIVTKSKLAGGRS